MTGQAEASWTLYYQEICRIFGILHLSSWQKHQHASSNFVYYQHFYLVLHSFIISEKVFHCELLDLVLADT